MHLMHDDDEWWMQVVSCLQAECTEANCQHLWRFKGFSYKNKCFRFLFTKCTSLYWFVCLCVMASMSTCSSLSLHICLCTPWASQLILWHCHPLCICALNIFAIACCSFTFRYSLHHGPHGEQHSQCTLNPPSPNTQHKHTHTYHLRNPPLNEPPVPRPPPRHGFLLSADLHWSFNIGDS